MWRIQGVQLLTGNFQWRCWEYPQVGREEGIILSFWIGSGENMSNVDAINIVNEMKELLPSLLLHKVDTLSPENFYLQKVSKLPNIEAITYEDLSHIKYFTTILSKRDIDIREHIYDIEMEMFTLYPDSQFNFSVTYLRKPNSLGVLIRNKRVLFHKDSIYGR